jgi:Uncharacterized alpha/beta hydrolase domain (DUF2235)
MAGLACARGDDFVVTTWRPRGSWPSRTPSPNVLAGRHAVAIDEKRRPFREYRVAPNHNAIEEVWFAGVNSDVGGGFLDKPCLSDIALNLTYHRRPVPANALIHASVARRMATQPGYGRRLHRDSWADPGGLTDGSAHTGG